MRGRLKLIRKAGHGVMSMKETSKEAKPAPDRRETQVNEIIQTVSYWGALSRKQISDLSGIGYTSVCPRILDNIGTIFQMVSKELIDNRRFELIDLIRRRNKPVEIFNKKFYKRKELNNKMYKGKTTKCTTCKAKVKAKENEKPIWRQDGFKENGDKRWKMIDLDDETHDCRRTEEKRDEHVLEETKKQAAGISNDEFEETMTQEEMTAIDEELNPRLKELTGVIPDPDFQTGLSKLAFDRTFKIIEMTASVQRKCLNETITQLPKFESLSFLASFKIQMELGANIQKILSLAYSEGVQSVDRQIEEARVRLSNLTAIIKK